MLQDAGKNGVKAEEKQEEDKQAGKGTKRKANGRKTGGAAGRVLIELLYVCLLLTCPSLAQKILGKCDCFLKVCLYTTIAMVELGVWHHFQPQLRFHFRLDTTIFLVEEWI